MGRRTRTKGGVIAGGKYLLQIRLISGFVTHTIMFHCCVKLLQLVWCVREGGPVFSAAEGICLFSRSEDQNKEFVCILCLPADTLHCRCSRVRLRRRYSSYE